ncbi:MAG: hypothetical protein ACKO5P_10435 [Nodosilinea sp.]
MGKSFEQCLGAMDFMAVATANDIPIQVWSGPQCGSQGFGRSYT